MSLRLYNTASRSKEDFSLPEGVDKVRLYCCGPTVYHYAHIGNLRTYIFEDLLRRTLEYNDFGVNHVVNITDVGHLTSDADAGEDKMEKGARRTGKSVWEVAEFYTQAFMKDFDRLNCIQPTIWAKATDHIQQQIELVETLDEKGFVYHTADGLYFDSNRFERYGEFANLDIEGLQQGSRIEMGEKKSPTDFALWKHSPKEEQRAMEWKSPWGVGFPGWHIECSAMAMHHLGPTLDIHCGGTDHVRIHHTNEIAQSECATGEKFSRFWLHGEFLRMGNSGGKMSKSADEFLTLQLLVDKGFSAMDYRYLALNSHYRNYLNFTWEALESARESLKSLHKKTDVLLGKAGEIESSAAQKHEQEFLSAINDDLNIPRALGILHTMLKDSAVSVAEKAALVLRFDQVFGLGLDKEQERVQTASALDDAAIEQLLEQRKEARNNKDFAEADRIRDELLAAGVIIKDSPAGTTWEFK
jgi:cysteinyl-tRNA synthetase